MLSSEIRFHTDSQNLSACFKHLSGMTFFNSNGDECCGDGAGDGGGVRASSVMSDGGTDERGRRGGEDKASSRDQPHVIVLCPITQFEQACRKVARESAPQGYSDDGLLLRPVSSATETEPAVVSARGGPYREDAAALDAAGV